MNQTMRETMPETMTETMTESWQLPDPDYQPEFYADVPLKRFLAFVVDTALLVLLVLVIALFSFGFALIFLGPLWWLGNFAYRWASLANGSATPGMRLVALEFRSADGRRLGPAEAFLHTAGFMFSFTVFPVQILSMALMATTPRAQGLTDLVLGTVALNRRARA